MGDEIQRWTPKTYWPGNNPDDVQALLHRDPNGQWVARVDHVDALSSLRAENERLLEQLETVAGQRRQLNAEVMARVEQNNALRDRIEKTAQAREATRNTYRPGTRIYAELSDDVELLRSLLSVPEPDFEGGDEQ